MLKKMLAVVVVLAAFAAGYLVHGLQTGDAHLSPQPAYAGATSLNCFGRAVIVEYECDRSVGAKYMFLPAADGFNPISCQVVNEGWELKYN